MYSGVVPYNRPCLYLTIGHTCWSVLHFNRHFDQLSADEEWWLQVWCYSYRGAITSDMFGDPVLNSDMPACRVQLYQTYMLGSFIQIHVFVSGSPSGENSGM